MTSKISKKKSSKKQELQELPRSQPPATSVARMQPPVTELQEPQSLPSVTELQHELPETEAAAEAEAEAEAEKPKKIKRIVKPRTEKQIESLKQGRLKRDQQQNERRKIKEEEDIVSKQELEKKLIDKAIKVKKKQLKRIEIFNELSDDDIVQPPLAISVAGMQPQVIQKLKQTKTVRIQPKVTDIGPNYNPYDEFKKTYNIR